MTVSWLCVCCLVGQLVRWSHVRQFFRFQDDFEKREKKKKKPNQKITIFSDFLLKEARLRGVRDRAFDLSPPPVYLIFPPSSPLPTRRRKEIEGEKERRIGRRGED